MDQLPTLKAIGEQVIDDKVRRLLRTMHRVGLFEHPELQPEQAIDNPQHRSLARQVAAEGIVLLKNSDSILPLDPSRLQSIAVIGPNADDVEVLLGNYNGFPADPVTPLRGIREKVSPGSVVSYARGTDLAENLAFRIGLKDSQGF